MAKITVLLPMVLPLFLPLFLVAVSAAGATGAKTRQICFGRVHPSCLSLDRDKSQLSLASSHVGGTIAVTDVSQIEHKFDEIEKLAEAGETQREVDLDKPGAGINDCLFMTFAKPERILTEQKCVIHETKEANRISEIENELVQRIVATLEKERAR